MIISSFLISVIINILALVVMKIWMKKKSAARLLEECPKAVPGQQKINVFLLTNAAICTGIGLFASLVPSVLFSGIIADFRFGMLERVSVILAVGLLFWANFCKYISRDMQTQGMKRNILVALLAGSAIFLLLGVEMFVFHFRSFLPVSFPEYAVDMADYLSGNDKVRIEDQEIIIPKSDSGTEVGYDALNIQTVNMTLRIRGDSNTIKQFEISVRDEATYYQLENAYYLECIPAEEKLVQFALRSNGPLEEVVIYFPEGDEYFVSEISFNKPWNYEFDSIRYLFFLSVAVLAILVIVLKWYNLELILSKSSCRIVIAMLIGMCLLSVFTVFRLTFGEDDEITREYPFTDPSVDWDPHALMLDAFQKGQLHLDTPGDAGLSELQDLVNPYDPSERDEAGVDYHWDYVYFEGKYYCYFGAMPVFVAYYPVFWITGRVPSPQLAGTILAFMTSLFLLGALYQMLRYFCRKINLLLFLLTFVAVFFGGKTLMLQSCADRYYLSILCGQMFFYASVFFAFWACRSRRAVWRRILFMTCGICVISILASRVPVILMIILFLMPLFLSILFDKDRKKKEKFLDAGAFLIPVIIGGVIIMLHNYFRFHSPFEFGAKYHLTVEDIRYNTFFPESILSAVHYYFFIMPEFSSLFPWIRDNTNIINRTGNYLFSGGSIGVFSIPLTWLMFLGFPKMNLGKRKRHILLGLWCAVLVGGIVIATFEYVYAGVMERYVTDLLSGIILLSAVFLMMWIAGDHNRDSRRLLYSIAVLLCVVTILVGVLGIFSNERNRILENAPSVFLRLRKTFALPS